MLHTNTQTHRAKHTHTQHMYTQKIHNHTYKAYLEFLSVKHLCLQLGNWFLGSHKGLYMYK